MSGIRVYSVMERKDMADRRNELRHMKKNNYQNTPNEKIVARQAELNFLEVLLEAQGKESVETDNYQLY